MKILDLGTLEKGRHVGKKHLTYERRWSLSLLLTLLCLLIPSVASANGAMSLALATFAWGPWLAYVVVTIVFEAAALSKWLHVPFARAFQYSFGANCLTALLGGFFSGFVCALLGFYGGRLNPNPFGQTLVLFTLFGSLSALVEAYFWRAAITTPLPKEATPGGSATLRPWQVTVGCLIGHLVGVPVGLAVLLIPSRPYPGLEDQVYATRVYYLEERDLQKALQGYIGDHQALPPVHSYGELLQLLKPNLGQFANDPDLWAAAYVPEYHRFDTTERRRDPIEWNSRAAGYKLSYDGRTLWLIRSRYYGFCEGFVLSGSGVKRTRDPKELGYSE